MIEYSLYDAPLTPKFENLFLGRSGSATPLRFLELPAASHRPHKGFIEDLIFKSESQKNLTCPTAEGHNSSELSFTSFTKATLHGPTGIALIRDNTAVSETLVSPHYFYPHEKIVELVSRKIEATRHITEPCVSFSHGAFAVYGHFVCEILASMFSILPLLRDGKIKIIMPPMPVKFYDWPDHLLDQLGVPQHARIHLTDKYTSFRNLIICSSCSGSSTFKPGMALPRFGQNLRQQVKPSHQKLRLYLSRSGSASNTQSRSIENEDKLIVGLKKLNFVALEPSQLPLAKQVELFAEAEYVFGVHGSAFANIAFCKPGTMIGEILPAHWAEKGGHWIANMSNVCDHKYFYMLAESTELTQSKSVVHIDPAIVVDRVQRSLSHL